jgi:tRNA A-37 threonylcarbamoyl transferase component Bud32
MKLILDDIRNKFGADIVVKDYNFCGSLNTKILILINGEKYVVRFPKADRRNAYDRIIFELRGIGFLVRESDLKFRSVEDQFEITRRAKQHVRCQEIVHYCPRLNYLLIKYVDGVILDVFLKTGGNPSIVLQYLSDITKYQHEGICLGDRWGPNEIVTTPKSMAGNRNEHSITFIDFDLAYLKDAVRVISEFFCSVDLARYDLQKIIFFMKGLSEFWRNDEKEGGRSDEVCSLFAILNDKDEKPLLYDPHYS